MLYLASPYSHPDAAVRDQRYRAAGAATAAFVRAGHLVYSPVVHGHPLTAHGIPCDWPFWEPHARWYLEHCEEVVVLMLEGWRDSVGVQAEISLAGELGKIVWYRYPVRAWAPTLAVDATEARY